MPSKTAFISYNQEDREAAQNIALFLTSENINVWFDEWEISAGDSIIKQINKGLTDCTHFVTVWSCHSATSSWVRSELEAVLQKAIEVGKPKIIPVLLDKTPLPPLLQPLKYLRYHGGTEEDRATIIESILGHKPSDDFIRSVVKKYHEVIIDADAKGPFAYRACPTCGSKRLKWSSATDYARDDVYYFIECEDCGWSDWSQ